LFPSAPLSPDHLLQELDGSTTSSPNDSVRRGLGWAFGVFANLTSDLKVWSVAELPLIPASLKKEDPIVVELDPLDGDSSSSLDDHQSLVRWRSCCFLSSDAVCSFCSFVCQASVETPMVSLVFLLYSGVGG
jgi:hypothetical protein